MSYGAALQRARIAAGVSVRDVARAVDVGEAHIRDVEAGRRGPLSLDATRRAAAMLRCDPVPLVEARVESRGYVELAADDGPRSALAVRLALAWDVMTDVEVEQLREALDAMRLPDGRKR